MKLATRFAILSTTLFQFLPLVCTSLNKKPRKFNTLSEFNWQNHNEAQQLPHSDGVGNSYESDPDRRPPSRSLDPNPSWYHNSQSYSHSQPEVGNNPHSYSDLHGLADLQSQAYGTFTQGNQLMSDDGSALSWPHFSKLPYSFDPIFGSGPYPHTSEYPTGSTFHVDNVNMAQLENTFAIPTHTPYYNAVPLYTEISGLPHHAHGNLNPTGPAHQSHGYSAFAQGDQQMYGVNTSPLATSSSQFLRPHISPQELFGYMENNLAGSSSNGGYNMNHQLATPLAHYNDVPVETGTKSPVHLDQVAASPCKEKSKVFDVDSSLEDFGQITKLKFPKIPKSRKIATLVSDPELINYTNRVPNPRPINSKTKFPFSQGLLEEICHRNCAFLLLFRVPNEPSKTDEINAMVNSESDLKTQRKLLGWSVARLLKAMEENGKSSLDNYILKYFQEAINESGSKQVKTNFPNSHTIYIQTNTQADLLKTQLAVHMLGEYYKSENSDKWKLIFTEDRSFIRLFAKLGQAELIGTAKWADIMYKAARGTARLNIFPWSALPTFTMEDFKTKHKDFYSMINS